MDVFGEVDPAADFLAREQSELAGLEDDLKNVTLASATLDGFENQNGISSFNGEYDAGSEEVPPFTNGNDDIKTESIDGFLDNEESVQSDRQSTPAPLIKAPREEPEKIRIWREEQKKRLEEKDLNEAKKIEEWREAAKKELEEWYRHHEELVAKTKAANRNAEKEQVAAEDELVPGTEWERIAKLCDFNQKTSKGSKDVSRMRSIILQLKQNPLQRNTS